MEYDDFRGSGSPTSGRYGPCTPGQRPQQEQAGAMPLLRAIPGASVRDRDRVVPRGGPQNGGGDALAQPGENDRTALGKEGSGISGGEIAEGGGGRTLRGSDQWALIAGRWTRSGDGGPLPGGRHPTMVDSEGGPSSALVAIATLGGSRASNSLSALKSVMAWSTTRH